MSLLKSYKLNKTFENSMYPVEQELVKISKSTKKSFLSILGSLVTFSFGGIGANLLFNENGIPKLIAYYVNPMIGNKPNIQYTIWYILGVVITFVLLCIIGAIVLKLVCREKNKLKKKKQEKGREELLEVFHKSIINNIVIGISFSDKAEDEKYKTKVEKMYLFEAVYYFKLAELEIESMELFDTEKNEYNDLLLLKIGIETIRSTLLVFESGLRKVYTHLPQSDEKDLVKNIANSVKTYQGMLNRMQNDN